MICSENNSRPVSAVPDQQLLRELMPKLGLEATEPKGRYKNQLRLRYLLPKALIVCVLAALVMFACYYALSPARVSNLRVSGGADRVAVEFDVNKTLLLESVTAQLDGRPVDVEYQTVGSYKVDLDKNGELVIGARTFTGGQSQTQMTVNSIDDEPPHISDHELTDGQMCIYFTDNGGTGIDWSTLRASEAATGRSFEIPEVNEEAAYIRFPFPSSSIRITLEDNNQNPLAVLLELVQADGTAAPPELAEEEN